MNCNTSRWYMLLFLTWLWYWIFLFFTVIKTSLFFFHSLKDFKYLFTFSESYLKSQNFFLDILRITYQELMFYIEWFCWRLCFNTIQQRRNSSLEGWVLRSIVTYQLKKLSIYFPCFLIQDFTSSELSHLSMVMVTRYVF